MLPSRSLRTALVAAILVVAIAPAARAHFDEEPCNGLVTTYAPIDGGPILYTDDRGPMPPSVAGITGGVWHYLESNQHEGLQGGGDHAVLGETGGAFFEDPCDTTHGPGTSTQRGPDLLIF